MGKSYNAEELTDRTFYMSMTGIGLFIAVVFLFIL